MIGCMNTPVVGRWEAKKRREREDVEQVGLKLVEEGKWDRNRRCFLVWGFSVNKCKGGQE